MIEYPSIPHANDPRVKKWSDKTFYLFGKLDGTNIRSEWSEKRGFYKFGTRKGLFGPTHRIFGSAIDLIKEQEDALAAALRSNGVKRATLFFEFLGDRSFAGWHDSRDEKRCVLFDVSIHNMGFINPKKFVKIFETVVDIPEVLYYGLVSEEIVEAVNKGDWYEMPFEGVVCKAASSKTNPNPIMFKIKSQDWYDKVKDSKT